MITLKRALVFRLSSFGDILLVIPAIDLLFKNYDEVHVLTKESFKNIFLSLDPRIKVHSIHSGMSFLGFLKFSYVIKKNRFSAIYDLHSNLRSRLFCLILFETPVYRISKFRLKETLLFLLKRSIYLRFFKPINRYHENLRVVQQAASTTIANYQKPHSPRNNRTLKLPPSYICLSTETQKPYKQWPIHNFFELARELLKKNYQVVWVGQKKIEQKELPAGSINLLGTLSTSELVEVIENSATLISNDSGLVHLAELLNIPVIAIFGPTSPELGFAPRLSQSQVVQTNLWCRPCSKTNDHCFRFEKFKCLTEISVASVLEALNRLDLEKKNQTSFIPDAKT